MTNLKIISRMWTKLVKDNSQIYKKSPYKNEN
jgi:hypothetical protein